MPGFIVKSLHKLYRSSPLSTHNSPHKWIRPHYGAIIQYAPDDDTTSKFDKDGKTKFQKIVGTLLYYARDVDFIMLIELNTIAYQQ